eukprot:3566622-Rhodomonas_salina.2
MVEPVQSRARVPAHMRVARLAANAKSATLMATIHATTLANEDARGSGGGGGGGTWACSSSARCLRRRAISSSLPCHAPRILPRVTSSTPRKTTSRVGART